MDLKRKYISFDDDNGFPFRYTAKQIFWGCYYQTVYNPEHSKDITEIGAVAIEKFVVFRKSDFDGWWDEVKDISLGVFKVATKALKVPAIPFEEIGFNPEWGEWDHVPYVSVIIESEKWVLFDRDEFADKIGGIK